MHASVGRDGARKLHVVEMRALLPCFCISVPYSVSNELWARAALIIEAVNENDPKTDRLRYRTVYICSDEL